MNGSENGYAGALFLTLMSIGAFLKLDGDFGWAVGAVLALAAAISLRRALNQSAQSAEEDHQRMEVQFQQLRSKVGETSSANFAAINSLTDTARLVQENFQVIRVRLAELDNLTQLTQSTEAIRSTLAALDKNSAAPKAESEKIFAAQEKNFVALAEELKKLIAIEEANKANLQTVLKLVQVVGQMLKNPAYAKDLEKISSTLELLAEQKSFAAPKPEAKSEAKKNPSAEGLSDGNRQDLSLRKKIAAKLKRK